MEDLSLDIVFQLKDKCIRLIDRYEQTRAEAVRLNQEIVSLKEELQREQEFITVLKEKNKRLQLAEAFKASSEDTNDAKMKIGRIVREIDRCIALLNR